MVQTGILNINNFNFHSSGLAYRRRAFSLMAKQHISARISRIKSEIRLFSPT